MSEVPLKREGTCRATIKHDGRGPKGRSINFADLPDVPEVPGIAPLSPDRYDVETAIEGVKKRYARQVPRMARRHLRPFKRFVNRWVRSNFAPIHTVMDFDEWLASTSYNEHRKQQLRDVYERWVRGTVSSRDLHKIKAFLKLESYPEYKHARHINARCDLAKVVFGPACKSMEQVVYAHPAFIKHVPLPERPALLRALKQAGCRYLESDHTAFEAHFTLEVMEVIEFTVVEYLMERHPDLVRLFSETEAGKNNISLDIGLRILMQYCRCSGDMWTSLMNGLANLLSLLFALSLTGATWVGGYVEGDDGIFAIHGTLPTSALMEELGFEVKYVEHDDPATASFCGLILAGESIIRDPMKFFQNFGWSDRFIAGSRRVKRGLALAKALSALYETPNCPLVSAAARYVYEQTKGVEPRWDGRAYKQVPRDFRPPSTCIEAETRELFSLKYGVSPIQQQGAEERIAKGDFAVLTEVLHVHPHVLDYSAKYVELGC